MMNKEQPATKQRDLGIKEQRKLKYYAWKTGTNICSVLKEGE